MKRGQVTYFIIAGLIVLLAVILIFSARLSFLKDVYEEQTNKLIGVPADIKPVEDYIQGCLNDVSKTGVDFVLLQGGYYGPNNSVELDLFKVAYWYDGKDVSPSLETVQNEISKFIDENIVSCIINFPDNNYNLTFKEQKASTKINNKNILINLNLNMNINFKNITFKLNKRFNVKLDSDAYDIYNSAKEIVKSEELNPSDIDLTFLAEIPYDINFFKNEEDEIVYVIESNQTTLYFANRFK